MGYRSAAVTVTSCVALAACGGAAQQDATPESTTTVDAAVTGAPSPGPQGELIGVARLADPQGTARGTLQAYDLDGRVEVEVTASGLEPGVKGLHLHAVGACEADSPDPKDPAKKGDFLSAGGHLGDGAHPEHAGDLPSLVVARDGSATLTAVSDRVTPDQLLDGDGTAVVVHGGPDNFANIPTRYASSGPDAETTKAGDSGPRVACGVLTAP